ncbi:PiggyBac transposable element-derived protein 4 [Biomphalaria glabrata]|nr:piggyBac transposable element-derived protein 4-like [Biomphalaria glabrata]
MIPTNILTQSAFEEGLIKILVRDMEPIAALERSGFRKFCSTFLPKYLSSHQKASSQLQELYNVEKTEDSTITDEFAFTPYQSVSIDEMIIGWKRRCGRYKMFNAAKPYKNHIKSFGLVDYGANTPYNPEADPNGGMAIKIFDTLLNHLGKGYYVYADKGFEFTIFYIKDNTIQGQYKTTVLASLKL